MNCNSLLPLRRLPEQGLQLTDYGKTDDKSCLLVQCLNRMFSWCERVCWDMNWTNSLLPVAHHRVKHSSEWWVRPRTPCAENWCVCHQSGHLLDTILQRYNFYTVQSMWGLWWAKWHCYRFLSEYFSLPLSVSFHQCPTLTHSSITDTV